MVRPWRDDYDNMIVNYMAKEQFMGNASRNWKIPIAKRKLSYTPVLKSRIDLQKELQKWSHTTVGNSTTDDHLEWLVEKHVLIIHSKGKGAKRKTLYRLDTGILVNYFYFFLLLLTRLIVREKKKYGQYPEFVLSRLLQFVIGMAYS